MKIKDYKKAYLAVKKLIRERAEGCEECKGFAEDGGEGPCEECRVTSETFREVLGIMKDHER